MLVSIVGHAIFHTAGRRGPSTMDLSYLDFAGGAGGIAGADACGVVTVCGGISDAGCVTQSIYDSVLP
jgi:hypothetical protein